MTDEIHKIKHICKPKMFLNLGSDVAFGGLWIGKCSCCNSIYSVDNFSRLKKLYTEEDVKNHYKERIRKAIEELDKIIMVYQSNTGNALLYKEAEAYKNWKDSLLKEVE